MIISIKGTTFLDVLVRNLPYKFTFTAFIYSCFGVCPCFGPAEPLLYVMFPLNLALLQPLVGLCFQFLWPCCSLVLVRQLFWKL